MLSQMFNSILLQNFPQNHGHLVEELVLFYLVRCIRILVNYQCDEEDSIPLEFSSSGSEETGPVFIEEFCPFLPFFFCDVLWVCEEEQVIFEGGCCLGHDEGCQGRKGEIEEVIWEDLGAKVLSCCHYIYISEVLKPL